MRIWIISLTACALWACSISKDTSTIEGALGALATSISSGDEALVYQALTQKSHEELASSLKLLKVIDRQLSNFPAKVQPWARKEAFGDMPDLPTVSQEQQLFFKIVHKQWSRVKTQPTEEIYQGLTPKSLREDDANGTSVHTRTQEKWTLKKEGSIWKIAVFDAPLEEYKKTLEKSLQVIDENLKEIKHRRSLNLPLPKLMMKGG